MPLRRHSADRFTIAILAAVAVAIALVGGISLLADMQPVDILRGSGQEPGWFEGAWGPDNGAQRAPDPETVMQNYPGAAAGEAAGTLMDTLQRAMAGVDSDVPLESATFQSIIAAPMGGQGQAATDTRGTGGSPPSQDMNCLSQCYYNPNLPCCRNLPPSTCGRTGNWFAPYCGGTCGNPTEYCETRGTRLNGSLECTCYPRGDNNENGCGLRGPLGMRTCGGWCPDNQRCESSGGGCGCAPQPTLTQYCGTRWGLSCGGDCPSGQECKSDTWTGKCTCRSPDAPTCGSRYLGLRCGGSCPEGEMCSHEPGLTTPCKCMPRKPIYTNPFDLILDLVNGDKK